MAQQITHQKNENEAPLISLSLLIPTWNESATIGRTIIDAKTAIADLVDIYEILVIDDGGRDWTAATTHSISITHPAVRLVSHEPNRGYGLALRSGFMAATCNLVVFTDIARQFDVSQLDRFSIVSRAFEIVRGYRTIHKEPPLSSVYSDLFENLTQALSRTNIRDVDGGLRMFHRESLLNLTPIATKRAQSLGATPLSRVSG
ncbi:glycosyltransferase family 2 protein [Lacipirellula sp.]|uniref:glycosyltransferase family 2 protein n=1 Tax=Lacipirellula sp. TaxID=2691419 RepID=UPI003D0FD718